MTTGSAPRRTPLYDMHVAAGARMVDFAGWYMPVQYTSIIEEHLAVRSAAGMFDVSHMGEVEIEGPGALDVCARAFTNDPRSLEVGSAQYSLLPDHRGRILDDVIVYRTGAERFLVCVNAANAEHDYEHLKAFATDAARIVDRSAQTSLIALQGPSAAAILAPLAPSLAALERFAVAAGEIAGIAVLAARTGYTGEDGFEFFCANRDAPGLWATLSAAGAPHGVVAAGLGARDTLRLEAALPLYGHELGEEITPWEARVGWAVKLNRPDMTGFAQLRAAKVDKARRRLVGLGLTRRIAREGYKVLQGDTVVGEVTSGSHCPSLGRAAALALVNANAIDADIAVEVRGESYPAQVLPLPFYKRAQ